MAPMADSGGGERRRSSRVPPNEHFQSQGSEVQVTATTPTSVEVTEVSGSPDNASVPGRPNLRKRKVASAVDGSIEKAMEPLNAEEREGWKGWIELESEPFLFNHVLRAYGVKDVRIQEVIELDMLPSLDSVHGLIFLFKFRDSDAEEDGHIPRCPKHIWFANQTTDNACATIAILNIVMNTSGLELGEALTDFKGSTKKLKPAYRGLKLSQNDFIRTIHNSFVRRMDLLNTDLALQNDYDHFVKKRKVLLKKPTPVPRNSKTRKLSKTQSKLKDTSKPPQKKEDDDDESGYHFIAYVPVNGSVWRLDGLRRQPVNIGHCGLNWTAIAHQNILQRMALANSIDFNLMSLVECPLVRMRHELAKIAKSIEALEGALDVMVPDWKVFIPNVDFRSNKADLEDSFNITQQLIETSNISEETSKVLNKGDPNELLHLRTPLENQLTSLKAAYISEVADIEEENEKAERRKHDRSQEVYHSIKVISETGALKDIVLGLDGALPLKP